MEGYVLELVDISKRFPGVVALDQVGLKVRPGTVHALMGENGAGKSTLMKCLFGIYQPDQGSIVLKGRTVRFTGAKDALEAGVSMIHQELANVPQRSVQENLWLGREPLHPWGLLDHGKMRGDTVSLMKRLDMDIAPSARMSDLSISQQQAVEIAKAVSYDASVVVMDEPTSSLTEKEAEHLFRLIRDLTSRNVAVIYISHKMNEIFRIADEISIMRDGRMLGTWPASELDEDSLIQYMVGRESQQRFPDIPHLPGQVRLKVSALSSADPRSFQGVSFDLREGEILGIGGLVGSQRTELVEAVFGLRAVASGSIELGGRKVSIRHSRDAIARGIGLITEDRRGSGIFPLLSLTVNTALPSLDRWSSPVGFLRHRDIAAESKRINDSLRTKAPHMETPIQNLSGGNQQKVLVSRWLMTLPDILIMDEPTRGIDVGAKYEIYTIMAELVRNGKSIIMVSSEMPELLGMSHRILVLCAGRATGVLLKAEANQEAVMRLAAQYE